MAMTQTLTSLAVADLEPIIHANRIVVRSDYRVKDAIKAVPGARWDNVNKVWHLPLSWPACLALRAELGDSLSIGPALSAWAFNERATKSALREQHINWLDPIELDGDVFDGLFVYQKNGAAAIRDAGGYSLFDQTGTGKSRTSLAGLALISQTDEIFPLLVVAPKSMLLTWAHDELPRFFEGASISVIAGTPSKMKAALEPGSDIYVCSYDTLRRYSRLEHWPTLTMTADEKTEKELNAIGFRSVIADEAHRIKNPTSKQTRALWHIGDRATYRVALTGSPIQDTPEDMWSIMRFVAPHEYPSKTAFVERYLDVSFNMWGGREIKGLNPLREAEFRSNAETRYRRVTKEVALKFLPPKVYETRWVELPAKHRKAYDGMVKMMMAELESGETLTAASVLERAGRLIQLANASGTIDPDDGTFRMELPSPKIDAFIEDVVDGDFDGQQVVVYSDSRQLIDLLSEVMTKKKIAHVSITGSVTGDDRKEAMDRFQAGEVPFILLTRAGGEGITLTAASTMVRLVRSWSYIHHTQAEDRVHRIGSEKHTSVTYIDYITSDTLEEGQIARLNAKGMRAQEVLRDDELKAILRKT